MNGKNFPFKNFDRNSHSSTQITNRGNPFITADRTWGYYLKGKVNGNGGLK